MQNLRAHQTLYALLYCGCLKSNEVYIEAIMAKKHVFEKKLFFIDLFQTHFNVINITITISQSLMNRVQLHRLPFVHAKVKVLIVFKWI